VVATRTGKQCWTLITSGDSVTSAHWQKKSGNPTGAVPCPNTSDRGGRGPGNDPFFSYANAVFRDVAKFAGGNYYNYARTGFTTTDMLQADPAAVDACGNTWGKPQPPVGMVTATAAWEKEQKRKVAWVTTGGVNDTNWSGVLENFLGCSVTGHIVTTQTSARRLGYVSMMVTFADRSTHQFDGTAADNRAIDRLLREGGSCRFVKKSTFGSILMDSTFTVALFNIGGVKNQITGNVKTAVEAGIAAKIDRIVWLGYYDISKAEIDVAAAAPVFGLTAAEATRYLGARFKLARTSAQAQTLRDQQTALNKAICDGVTAAKRANPTASVMCTKWTDPNFTGSGDIQDTVKGGMPHPSEGGQRKLAEVIKRHV
jgi:hypothetical protein